MQHQDGRLVVWLCVLPCLSYGCCGNEFIFTFSKMNFEDYTFILHYHGQKTGMQKPQKMCAFYPYFSVMLTTGKHHVSLTRTWLSLTINHIKEICTEYLSGHSQTPWEFQCPAGYKIAPMSREGVCECKIHPCWGKCSSTNRGILYWAPYR